MLCGCGMLIKTRCAMCRRGYSSLFVCVQKFTLFFLNIVITTAIKFYMHIVTVVSYHFTFFNKEIY